MRKLLLLTLLALLLVFAGCGEEGENGEGEEVDVENVGEEGFPTQEKLVDTFIEAANSRDKDTVYACFNTPSNADSVWERIEKYDMTFSEGYTIEPDSMYDTVIFDSARWEDFEVYEQELYVAQWNGAGEEIEGYLFNGQGWHYPEDYLEDEAADEEAAGDEEVADDEAAENETEEEAG